MLCCFSTLFCVNCENPKRTEVSEIHKPAGQAPKTKVTQITCSDDLYMYDPMRCTDVTQLAGWIIA